MDIFFRIFFLAMGGVFLIMLLKRERAEWGVLLSLAVGCVMLFLMWPQLQALVEGISAFAPYAENKDWLEPVIKITGAAFVGEWGVQACRDAGENAVAYKLELATKLVILVLALPLINQILALVGQMLNQNV